MSTISSAMASGKRNLRLLSIAILVMATSFAPNSVVSGSSIPLNSLESSQLSSPLYSKVSLERAAVTEFLYDSMDRLNGGQFLELVDPLMEGQLSRIIEQIKHKYSEQTLNRLAFAPELPARQFLSILDYLSSGQVSASLHASFPTLLSSNILADRPRRASLDTMSGLSLGYAKKRSLDPMSGLSFGAPAKRAPGGNFDEMDRTGFSGFAKRRSDFDEIDRAGFSGFAKRHSDFDEIDRSGFSGFAKRRSDFDEIDRAGFSGFAKRRSDFDEIDRAGFSGFAKRFNFDELDRNGFTGFLHKRAMNPLVSMMQSQELSRKQKAAEAQKQSQPEQAVPVKQQSKA